MSITLVEASRLATDVLVRGIIESIVRDSPILQNLPFIQITGNSLRYNRERSLPVAAWHAPVTGTWTASPPTFEEVTTSLRVLGVDADVDNFLKATRSNVQDLEAACIELAAKSVRHEFENAFLNGDNVANPNQFDGLFTIIRGVPWAASTAIALGAFRVPTAGLENGFRYEATVAGTTGTAQLAWPVVEGATVVDGGVTWTTRLGNHIGSGANGATLALASLDRLIDQVRGARPDLLLMSRRSRRRIQSLARAAGTNLIVGEGLLGQQVEYFNGIPLAISDWVRDNYTVGTSTDCSAIFAMELGEGAVAGLTSPEMLQIERLGPLETRDANRTRIKWYCGLANFSIVKAAMLTGVRDV
jgi:hypothetical protein